MQSNMGEEITNGVSDVLQELYGVLELMTVYMLCLGTGCQELRKQRLTKSLDSDENFKP